MQNFSSFDPKLLSKVKQTNENRTSDSFELENDPQYLELHPLISDSNTLINDENDEGLAQARFEDFFKSESESESSSEEHKKKKRKSKHKHKHKHKPKHKESWLSKSHDLFISQGTGLTNRPIQTQARSRSILGVNKVGEYYFDVKGDKNSLIFDGVYKKDVPRYRRKRVSGCLGFPDSTVLRATSAVQNYGYIIVNLGDSVTFHKNDRYSGPQYAAELWDRTLRRITMDRMRRDKTTEGKEKKKYYGSWLFADEDMPDNKKKLSTTQVNKNYIELSLEAQIAELEDEGETLEERLMRRTRLLTQRTMREDCTAEDWMDLIAFQDEFEKLSDSRGGQTSLLEKKIAIYQKALKIFPSSERLVLDYLATVSKLWSPAKVSQIWANVLSAQGNAFESSDGSISGNLNAPLMNDVMWNEYINFCLLSNLSEFSIPLMREVFVQSFIILNRQRASASLDISDGKGSKNLLRSIESLMLSLLCRLVFLELQSGHTERAIGLFQAVVEFNECCFQVLTNAQTRPVVMEKKDFLVFWENELPRIGEKGAVGFNEWKRETEKEKERLKERMKELERRKKEMTDKEKENRNQRKSLLSPENNTDEVFRLSFSEQMRMRGEALISATEIPSEEESEDDEIDVGREKVRADKMIISEEEDDKNEEGNEVIDDGDNDVEMFLSGVSKKIDEKNQSDSFLRNEGISMQISKRISARAQQELNDRLARQRARDWAEQEEESEAKQWKPVRLITLDNDNENDDDLVDSVVLASDIQDFLFRFSDFECQFELVLRFLLFLGVPLSHCFPSSLSMFGDSLNGTEECSTARCSAKMKYTTCDYRQMLIKGRKHKDEMESGKRTLPSWLWGFSSDQCHSTFGFSLWENIIGRVTETMMRKKQFDYKTNPNVIAITDFLTNAAQACFRAFPTKSVLKECVLLIIARVGFIQNDFTRTHTMYRSVLSESREDVLLWVSYAKQIANEGDVTQARKVFEQILQLSSSLSSSKKRTLARAQFHYAHFLLSQINNSTDPKELCEIEELFDTLLLLLVGAPSFSFDVEKRVNAQKYLESNQHTCSEVPLVVSREDINTSISEYEEILSQIKLRHFSNDLSFEEQEETALYGFHVSLYGILSFFYLLMTFDEERTVRKRVSRIFGQDLLFKYQSLEQQRHLAAFQSVANILTSATLPHQSLGHEIINESLARISLFSSISHSIVESSSKKHSPRSVLQKCCENFPANPVLLSSYSIMEALTYNGMKWREWAVSFPEQKHSHQQNNRHTLSTHSGNPLFYFIHSLSERVLFDSLTRERAALDVALRSPITKQNVRLWQCAIRNHLHGEAHLFIKDDKGKHTSSYVQQAKHAKSLFTSALRNVPWGKRAALESITDCYTLEDENEWIKFVEFFNSNEIELYCGFMEEKMMRLRKSLPNLVDK